MHELNRPELDNRIIGDWNLAFNVFAPDAVNSVENYASYSGLVTTMPADILPMYSISEGEVTFSMRIRGVTERQAVMIGYSNILTAFENANHPLVLKAARIASRLSIEAAMRDDSSVELRDISVEAMELERQITSIRDIE
jgi:hypothetical protein